MEQKFVKSVLASLERCYAVRGMQTTDGLRLMFATEGHGACTQFDEATRCQLENVWDEPGGTMSIVPIPGRQNEFLAVQKFFPTFQSEQAEIVWGKLDEENHWQIHPYISLPYVHRFDLLETPTGIWFVGATLCTSKKDKDDWSDPGKIWIGKLTENWDVPIFLDVLYAPLTKNHGYCRVLFNGVQHGVVSAEEGIYLLTPPQCEGKSWRVERIYDQPVSDMAFADIDADGCLECLTIEPFHGDKSHIYRWTQNGFERLWSYSNPMEFGHVVWGGKLGGDPAFILGYRKADAALLVIRSRDGAFTQEVLDVGQGPSNVDVVYAPGSDIIMAANRMTGYATLYELRRSN